MRYLPISNELFIRNRTNLAKHLKPNALAVFNANDQMPKSGDGMMRFQQNSDMFYLSGIDQEESILILYPDAPEEQWREILFLRETNEEIAIWEGEKLSKEQAFVISGIKTVHWLQDFPKIFNTLMALCEYVYLNTNEHLRAIVEVQTRDARFIQYCKEKYPLHKYERIAPLMAKLRMIKSPHEIELLQIACDITNLAMRRVMRFVKPNVMDYEVEAELIHEYLRNRCSGFAFSPIIASGANTCVLHYEANNKPCQSGDLLLIDTGATYANYNSDVTRTIPVSGRFTPRQKQVYRAVLNVMKEAKAMLIVGNNLTDYHKAVGEVMTKELVDLGLITIDEVKNQPKDKPAYKKYFMHGTSHHLGLDVHDFGNSYHKFEAGMVFTCEPGIYIREEKIGIRLEDDILLLAEGNYNFTANIPLEIEEVEAIMND